MIERARSFLAELRRRKVYHVGVVYVMVAFVIWQIADIALPSLGLPETAVGIVLVVTGLGFPIALVLAWAYEVRPEEPLASVDEPGARAVVGEPATQAASGPSQHRPPSVAILPFENMSSESESGYFADGITEEITNVLAGVADLHVAARTSSFAFKGSRVDIREIGRELNVSYVVEGSVRRADDALRITAQLIDTSTGYHVWSERFDREVGDVFEIQDEIAGAVAEKLAGHVAKSAAAPRPVVRTSELAAYDVYLKGREQVAVFDPPALLAASDRFEQCIRLDPGFAGAHASLAEALTLRAIGFDMQLADTMPRALVAANAATELDPYLPEAHLARALVSMYYERDYQAARASFDRAEELGPNVARVHMWREFYHTYVEYDQEAALAANRRARELSPMDVGLRLRELTVCYVFGDYVEAEALLQPLLASLPEGPEAAIVYVAHADVLARSGRVGEAIAPIERAVQLSPVVGWTAIMGMFYGAHGATDKAQAVLSDLEGLASEGHVSGFWLAAVHAGLGDLDTAFSLLETARDDRDSNVLYAFVAPRLAGWHEDPRFPEFLRSIGLSHLSALL